MLLFLNWQLDAISLTDPNVLRSVGTSGLSSRARTLLENVPNHKCVCIIN